MSIDTTPTEPPRNWFLEIASAPTEDLLRHAEHLRAKLAHAQERGLRVDVRAYELRLLDVERAIAIHNRRATEAEDQRAAVERAPNGLSERDQEILSVLIDDVQAFGAGDDDDRKDERFQSDTVALLRRLKLAERAGSAEQRELQEWAIDVVFDGPPGPESGRFVEVEDLSGKSVGVGQWIDRGNGMWALRVPRAHPAQREADLREAFLAGGRYIADNGVVSVVDLPREAAEYARSKAGGWSSRHVRMLR